MSPDQPITDGLTASAIVNQNPHPPPSLLDCSHPAFLNNDPDLCAADQEASSGQQAGRLEERVAALQADLAHNTAATDAMSAIIDQVQSDCLCAKWDMCAWPAMLQMG